MSLNKTHDLLDIVAHFPNTTAILQAVLKDWPDHANYLVRSFTPRSPAMLDATEAAARAVRLLMAGDDLRFAADYRWTCDRLRDEELYFHRNGRYRLSTFVEANEEVYSNEDYMSRYVNGLLLSQVLWYNHIATFEMFLNRVIGVTETRFDYLEVGPGHGLMTYIAAQSPQAKTVEAWDVSAVSLRETRAALDRLGAVRPISLVEQDILSADPIDRRFDLIVISEVLEHLERPAQALRYLRHVMSDTGRIFINVPINSPSPDHIYLLSTPSEVRELIESNGFRIDQLELFATQAKRMDNAIANRISVSAGVIAVPA
jgi:2-polyprenyl-3-methyl-5-hydroxy-6-metoxy-1,4-benzoquinol methylase